MQDLIPIQTVLVSVTDKSGLREFLAGLMEINPKIRLIASGGTAKELDAGGIGYTALNQYTGFPECFDGRVKTLHPHVAGGLLLRRGKDETEAEQLGISPIDMVLCNLYRFEERAADASLPMDELVEYMDIGGSTLIRAACKNYARVGVVTDPSDYPKLLETIREEGGALSLEAREKLAVKAINLSADYEAALAKAFTKRLSGEETARPCLVLGQKLRYGENPGQEGWVYKFSKQGGVANARLLSGKEPSYNNYEDANAAYGAVQELEAAGAAVVKHGSLCGFATGESASEAFQKAWEGDPKSAFGGVVAFNTPVNEELYNELEGKFIEVIVAPQFDEGFVARCRDKRGNLRLLEAPAEKKGGLFYRNVSGGMLVQTKKGQLFSRPLEELVRPAKEGGGIVTKALPETGQTPLFAFAVAAVNHAKSNAIAIAREWKKGCYQLVGVGAGQPNRVDSLQRLAVPKAQQLLGKERLEGCVMASDGFFPFDDSVRYAASCGIKYCIQPGGSKRDEEVVRAADELGLCMLFTGERYFTH